MYSSNMMAYALFNWSHYSTVLTRSTVIVNVLKRERETSLQYSVIPYRKKKITLAHIFIRNKNNFGLTQFVPGIFFPGFTKMDGLSCLRGVVKYHTTLILKGKLCICRAHATHTRSRDIFAAPAARSALKGTAPLCHLGRETSGKGGGGGVEVR